MARTILAVEDDPLNMRLFRDMLTWQGFTMVEAGDGERALALAAADPPDLVLLDIQLPGMSGLDLVRRFKEDARLRSVPIVAVTALALREHERLVHASGVDAYVTKPFSVAELLEIVRRHLPPEEPVPNDADATDGDDGALRPWSVAPGFSMNDPDR